MGLHQTTAAQRRGLKTTLTPDQMRRLKQLEDENAKLKKLVTAKPTTDPH